MSYVLKVISLAMYFVHGTKSPPKKLHMYKADKWNALVRVVVWGGVGRHTNSILLVPKALEQHVWAPISPKKTLEKYHESSGYCGFLKFIEASRWNQSVSIVALGKL